MMEQLELEIQMERVKFKYLLLVFLMVFNILTATILWVYAVKTMDLMVRDVAWYNTCCFIGMMGVTEHQMKRILEIAQCQKIM